MSMFSGDDKECKRIAIGRKLWKAEKKLLVAKASVKGLQSMYADIVKEQVETALQNKRIYVGRRITGEKSGGREYLFRSVEYNNFYKSIVLVGNRILKSGKPSKEKSNAFFLDDACEVEDIHPAMVLSGIAISRQIHLLKAGMDLEELFSINHSKTRYQIKELINAGFVKVENGCNVTTALGKRRLKKLEEELSRFGD